MAKLDKILGSISPAYGMASGQGLFGNGLAAIQDATGMGGIGPMIASEQRKKLRARRAADATKAEDENDTGMRRGGKVKKMAKGGSASRRGDGCATKGKTKGKFV